MSYIYWISQIQSSERSLVGNNFFILSQLLQHGCSIMPGFVLSHLYTTDFLADLDLVELTAHTQSDRARKIQFAANRSQQAIQNAPSPNLTAVLTATQQLNCASLLLQPSIAIANSSLANGNLWRSHTCNNDPQSIAAALKQVWSELFTAPSLLYCYQQGLKIADLRVAILVRPLPPASASGAIEIDENVLKISASWGLEQSVLQGEVEPDRYYLDRSTGDILSRYLGHKNYAYRPNNNLPSSSGEGNLEAYIPDFVRAQTYVLERLAISKLLQLTKVILEHQPQIKYLVWTAPATQDRSLPNFSFTQVSQDFPVASTLSDQENHSQTPLPSLLTGIAAAAGSVIAKVVILEQLSSDTIIPQGCILVTRAIAPQQIHLLKQVAGIITETGGTTSHGAIVARELNIPAIANATNATKILQQGIEVFLDGDAGKVYPAAAKNLATDGLSNRQQFNYPIATQLMVNLSQPESINQTRHLPLDGVGLLRSELMLTELLISSFPSQPEEKMFRLRFLDLLTSSLCQFVDAFAPRPVFYRSIDWYAQDESNPVLGNRGTYSYLNDPTLFYLELEALATIAVDHSNLKIILPFVRSVEEFKFCYRAIEESGLTNKQSFQVWIMAEVPSVMMLLPEYIRAGVQGIAIGTNDLTQLLLGVDREQAQFSDRGLNASHQAMQQAIYKLITVAKANDIGCCICGQAPVDYPELIPKLIAWGIDAISVEPEAISETYQAIARAERKMILKGELDR